MKMKITIRNLGFLYLALLFTPGIAHCQQISPTAEEFGKGHAKGFFTVSNLGVQPLTVSVAAQDMTVSPDGHPVLSATKVSVTFKEPQFKLGPKAIHYVNFDAACADAAPCHFVLFASFSPLAHSEGLTIVEKLGSSVYICDKQKNCRKDTIAQLNFPPPQK
jgi:hypothetical protein